MPQSATGAVAAKVAAETAESPAAAGGRGYPRRTHRSGVAAAVEAVVVVENTAVEAREKGFRPAAGGSEWSRSRNHLEPTAGHCCPEPVGAGS